jgi:hypothetical protein
VSSRKHSEIGAFRPEVDAALRDDFAPGASLGGNGRLAR